MVCWECFYDSETVFFFLAETVTHLYILYVGKAHFTEEAKKKTKKYCKSWILQDSTAYVRSILLILWMNKHVLITITHQNCTTHHRYIFICLNIMFIGYFNTILTYFSDSHSPYPCYSCAKISKYSKLKVSCISNRCTLFWIYCSYFF